MGERGGGWYSGPGASACRFALVLILAVALASLTALAHSTPPDPGWLGGLYDDADYDDVVLLATGSVIIPAESPELQSNAIRADTGLVVSLETGGTARSGIHIRHTPRSPPIDL